MISTALDAEDLRAHVRRLEEIPPLPQNIHRLLEVLGDDDVCLEDAARVIEESPQLAARIVGLSRSAFFGSAGQVRSVSDAIIRVLGLRLVQNIGLGIVLSGTFNQDRCPSFSCEQYWSSALLSATMARALARHASGDQAPSPDAAYLCGLLHNLGLLALVHVSPGEMTQVLAAASEEPGRPLTEIEVEYLGVHHCHAGAWLSYRWQLPDEVTCAMEHHHVPDYRGEHWAYALLIGVASRWSRQRLAGVGEPWVEPHSLRDLGISTESFVESVEQCEAGLSEIDDLGKLLAGRS